METKQQPKSSEYHSAITRECLALLVVNLSIAVWTLIEGLRVNHAWPGRGSIFIAAGILLMVGAAVLLRTSVLGKVIHIGGRTFRYSRGGKEIAIAWQSMRTFQPSSPTQKRFRSTLLGDDTHTLTIDSLSFRKYDEIVRSIEARLKAASGKYVI